MTVTLINPQRMCSARGPIAVGGQDEPCVGKREALCFHMGPLQPCYATATLTVTLLLNILQ